MSTPTYSTIYADAARSGEDALDSDFAALLQAAIFLLRREVGEGYTVARCIALLQQFNAPADEPKDAQLRAFTQAFVQGQFCLDTKLAPPMVLLWHWASPARRIDTPIEIMDVKKDIEAWKKAVGSWKELKDKKPNERQRSLRMSSAFIDRVIKFLQRETDVQTVVEVYRAFEQLNWGNGLDQATAIHRLLEQSGSAVKLSPADRHKVLVQACSLCGWSVTELSPTVSSRLAEINQYPSLKMAGFCLRLATKDSLDEVGRGRVLYVRLSEGALGSVVAVVVNGHFVRTDGVVEDLVQSTWVRCQVAKGLAPAATRVVDGELGSQEISSSWHLFALLKAVAETRTCSRISLDVGYRTNDKGDYVDVLARCTELLSQPLTAETVEMIRAVGGSPLAQVVGISQLPIRVEGSYDMILIEKFKQHTTETTKMSARPAIKDDPRISVMSGVSACQVFVLRSSGRSKRCTCCQTICKMLQQKAAHQLATKSRLHAATAMGMDDLSASAAAVTIADPSASHAEKKQRLASTTDQPAVRSNFFYGYGDEIMDDEESEDDDDDDDFSDGDDGDDEDDSDSERSEPGVIRRLFSAFQSCRRVSTTGNNVVAHVVSESSASPSEEKTVSQTTTDETAMRASGSSSSSESAPSPLSVRRLLNKAQALGASGLHEDSCKLYVQAIDILQTEKWHKAVVAAYAFDKNSRGPRAAGTNAFPSRQVCVDILITLAGIRHLLLSLPPGDTIILPRITTSDLEHQFGNLRGGRDTSNSLQTGSGTLGIPAAFSKGGITAMTQVLQFQKNQKYRGMKKIENTVFMKPNAEGITFMVTDALGNEREICRKPRSTLLPGSFTANNKAVIGAGSNVARVKAARIQPYGWLVGTAVI